jgi:hypothetical protein
MSAKKPSNHPAAAIILGRQGAALPPRQARKQAVLFWKKEPKNLCALEFGLGYVP